MRFSRRTDWDLTPNRISEALSSAQSLGRRMLDLTESNPSRCGFAYPHQELLAALQDTASLEYRPLPKGSLAARETICEYYAEQKINISPERIVLASSTSEAYSFLFRLLADPGEKVLFPSPSYPLFDLLVGINDLEQDFYPLVYEGSWALDHSSLRNIDAQVRALVMVNPNNPTGSYIKPQELSAMNRALSGRETALISDEVFFDYALDPQSPKVSVAGNTEILSFTLGGLSKTLGLPGMKLAWIVVSGPPSDVDAAVSRLEIIADTYLSVNTPVQHALKSWMRLRPLIQGNILERLRTNHAVASGAFRQSGLGEVLHIEGGWYMIVKLKDGLEEERIVLRLLREDGVYVHPGYFFNFPDEPYLVLSLLPRPEVFAEGVQKICERLQKG